MAHRTASLSNSAQQRYHEHTDISILCIFVMKDSEKNTDKGRTKMRHKQRKCATHVCSGWYVFVMRDSEKNTTNSARKCVTVPIQFQ